VVSGPDTRASVTGRTIPTFAGNSSGGLATRGPGSTLLSYLAGAYDWGTGGAERGPIAGGS